MNTSIGAVTPKSNFYLALKLELQRAVCSARFLMSIAMILVWMMMNAAEAVKSYDHAIFAGVTQLIRLGLDGHQSTGPVLLAISAIPYSLTFLTEKECGFQQQVMERIGVTTYGICKVISTGISAFLLGVASLWVFVGILSVFEIPHIVRYDEVNNTYAAIVITMGPCWYYAVKAFHVGLVCSQAALFSLMIMAWIPNAYVGFISPLIGYYVADCIYNLIGQLVDSPLWHLFSPMLLFFGQPLPDAVFSYFWTVMSLLVLAICFGIRFLIQLGKEYLQ